MKAKKEERLRSIELRKQGYSYSEIQKIIPVSQASLSLWLSNTVLEEKYVIELARKKIRGQQKGALKRREDRIKRERCIIDKSIREIDEISQRDLWLLGVMAYWCEGSKQKEHNVSERLMFSNTDPNLIRLYIKFLTKICGIPDSDILYNLYIHKSGDVHSALHYWSNSLQIPLKRFGKTTLKKHNAKTIRKNTGDSYHGLIKVCVRKSTDLNRKIKGWILGINTYI